ncbi:MAG TPA: arylesterase [Stellaceae bacterium]|nr:arylesterase [Stellaceae bacterium]
MRPLVAQGLAGYGGWRALVNCAAAALLALGLAAAAEARPVRVLAFGDSLTSGYGLPPEETFPARLEARLRADGVAAQIINAGVSGDTTAGALARLDWSLGDKPDYVLVELGANDALRGLDPQQAYANLDRILARLKAAQVKVMLLGMQAPANWGRDYDRSFDAIYPKLAAKWQVPLYPFFLDGVALDPKLTQGDGLHPNAKGVDIIVERLAPAVERWLAQGEGRG